MDCSDGLAFEGNSVLRRHDIYFFAYSIYDLHTSTTDDNFDDPVKDSTNDQIRNLSSSQGIGDKKYGRNRSNSFGSGPAHACLASKTIIKGHPDHSGVSAGSIDLLGIQLPLLLVQSLETIMRILRLFLDMISMKLLGCSSDFFKSKNISISLAIRFQGFCDYG